MPEDKDPHYLYKITNLTNQKLYIGVTKSPEVRKNAHLKYNVGSLLNKAVAKYGSNSFSFEVLCLGSEDYIYDLEKKVIILYDTTLKGHGYNTMPGGKQGKGNYKKSVDDACYVSGFWFPNKKTAMQSLCMSIGLFNSRKRLGLLGETEVNFKHHMQTPVYVSGFWFPSKMCALQHTSLSPKIYEKLRLEGSLGDPVINKNKSNLQD